MPLESAERRSGGAIGRKLGLVKDRIAEAQSIDPRLKVTETNTKLQGHLLRGLPRVLPKEFVGAVMNIVDTVFVRFVVGVQIAGEQVGIFVTVAKTVTGGNNQLTIRVVVGRL